MKLTELLNEETLQEASIKQLIAAGALAAASLGLIVPSSTSDHGVKTSQLDSKKQEKLQAEIRNLTKFVTDNYHVEEPEANAIVLLAKKHEQPTFPKAKNILAIIGIESAFKEKAVSKLHKDPAVGLMQVRPKTWGVTASSLSTVDKQIELGSKILNHYYTKLGDNEEHAVKAYNVGMGNFKKTTHNEKQKAAMDRYAHKYDNELKKIKA
jgi:hypothetical protein